MRRLLVPGFFPILALSGSVLSPAPVQQFRHIMGRQAPSRTGASPPCLRPEKLGDALKEYVKNVGTATAFDFYQYDHLIKTRAVHGPSIASLDKLAHMILDVCPQCEIVYTTMKFAIQSVLVKCPIPTFTLALVRILLDIYPHQVVSPRIPTKT